MKTRHLLSWLSALPLAVAFGASALSQEGRLSVEDEGLVEFEEARVDIAYILPDVDWNKYQTFYILPLTATPEARDATPKSLGRRPHMGESYLLEQRDVDDMIEDFADVMKKELQRKGTYQVVDKVGDDTLIIAAAIVDIELMAPIERTRGNYTGRGGTYTEYGGSLVISAVLAEGETRQILAALQRARTNRRLGLGRFLCFFLLLFGPPGSLTSRTKRSIRPSSPRSAMNGSPSFWISTPNNLGEPLSPKW